MYEQMPVSNAAGKRPNWLVIVLGLVVVCLCLVILGGGGYFLLQNRNTNIPGSPPQATFAPPDTPVPLDTVTPIPVLPSDTPTPLPTDTPTMMPTQSPKSIADAMIGLVDNVGVPEAAAYNKSQPGPHRMLLLTQDGELYSNYFDLLPNSWKPAYLNETELVAMITFQQAVQSTQRYRDSAGNVYVFRRIREDFYIRLKEAQTGKIIGEKIFLGQDPPRFQHTRYTDEDLMGNPPTVGEIEEWLKTFVNP